MNVTFIEVKTKGTPMCHIRRTHPSFYYNEAYRANHHSLWTALSAKHVYRPLFDGANKNQSCLEIYDNGSCYNWSTKHRENTTGDVLILLFLSESTWIRRYVLQDLGLSRSLRIPDISTQSTPLSNSMRSVQTQYRWTEELKEAVRNTFVNITPTSGKKSGNTCEYVVR